MEHFYQSVKGFFNEEARRFYHSAVASAVNGMTFVEVGAFLGQSTSYMATEIINSGKDIRLHVVDNWKWTAPKDASRHCADPYSMFLENIAPVRDKLTIHRMDSVAAAELFEDNSLDVVFLDAGHDYAEVYSDIVAWLPKVKSGGVLAGDDYCNRFSGLIAAVTELLPDHTTDGLLWVYRKP